MAVNILLAIASVAGLVSGMGVVRYFAKRFEWSAELQRKIVHICVGLFAMLLPWIFAVDWPIYLILALAMVAMVGLRLPRVRAGIGATLHTVERQSYGDFLLALSVGLVFLFSDREPILYVLPLAVLTLGDAAAALAGSAYGRRFFAVEDGHKSIEGSVIFFLVTTLIAMICLLLLSDVPRANVILLAILVSGFATLVEADSWRGFDNLFLPMGVLIFLAVNLHSPAWLVTAQMLLFVGAIVGFRTAGLALGLTAHSTRVYVITAFLILSVTDLQNALLPMILLGSHAFARRLAPGPEKFPDLDIVAAIALLSFGYLALGQAVGPNALSFYGLTCAAMATALVAVSASPYRRVLQLGVSALAALLFWTIWIWVQSLNAPHVVWHGNLNVLGALVISASALLPVLVDFSAARITKATAIGATPSVLAYVFLVLKAV